MADERWILVILLCLLVVITLIDAGLFTTIKIQLVKMRNLTVQNQQQQAQIQQQQVAINSFVSQLQRCKTIKDLDDVLKTVNVERIK